MSTTELEPIVEEAAKPVFPRLAQVIGVIRDRGLATGILEDEQGEVCFYGAMKHLGYFVHPDERPYGPDLEALARNIDPHITDDEAVCTCLDCCCDDGSGFLSRDICWSIITKANDSLPEARWLEIIERTAYGA